MSSSAIARVRRSRLFRAAVRLSVAVALSAPWLAGMVRGARAEHEPQGHTEPGRERALVSPLRVSMLTPEQVAAAQPITASDAVDLPQAIDEALRRDPRIEVAMQEIERAEALLRQARAAWLPTLHGNAQYTRLDDDRTAGSGVVLQRRDQVQLNLRAQAPLVAPREWVASRQAKLNVGVQRIAADEARRQVVLATARAYLTVIAQQRVIEVHERALDNARAHHQYARARFEGGIGNELDEVRAGQEVALNEAQLEAARAQLAMAQEALGVLLGRDAPVDAREPEVMPTGAELPATQLVLQRSDVLAQQKRVELAQQRVDDRYAEYLPYLNGSFLPFFQEPPTLQYPRLGWQAQLILTVPFYDGGLRQGLARERRAQLAQAKAQLDGLLRSARSEVRSAFSAMVQADKSLVAAARSAELARRALEMANMAYRAGATTDIEVVDAERRSRDAETGAVQAEDAARRARLELLVATGQLPDASGRGSESAHGPVPGE